MVNLPSTMGSEPKYRLPTTAYIIMPAFVEACFWIELAEYIQKYSYGFAPGYCLSQTSATRSFRRKLRRTRASLTTSRTRTSPGQLPVGVKARHGLCCVLLKTSAVLSIPAPCGSYVNLVMWPFVVRLIWISVMDDVICKANSSMLFTTDWSLDRECTHTGAFRTVSLGPPQIGLRCQIWWPTAVWQREERWRRRRLGWVMVW